MKNISYQELIDCQDYAEKVVDFYKDTHNDELPMTASDAEIAVREYNNELCMFKRLYGYSVKGYIQTIVDCIGAIVEQ